MLGREARVPNMAVKLPGRDKASRSLRPALGTKGVGKRVR